MNPGDMLNIKEVVDRNVQYATLNDLQKKGKNRFKVMKLDQFYSLIERAVNNVVERQALNLADADRAAIIDESNREFKKLFAERQAELRELQTKEAELVELREHLAQSQAQLGTERSRREHLESIGAEQAVESERRLQQEVARIRAQTEILQESERNLRAEADTARAEGRNLAMELESERQRRSTVEAQVTGQTQTAAQQVQQAQQQAQQVQQQAQQQLQAVQQQAEQNVRELESRLQEARAESTAVAQQAQTLQAEKGAVVQDVQRLKDGLETELRSTGQQLAEWKTRAESAISNVADRERTISEKDALIEQLRNEVARLQAEVERLMQANGAEEGARTTALRESLKGLSDALEAEKSQHKETMDNLLEETRAQRGLFDEVRELRAQLSDQSSAGGSAMAGLSDQMSAVQAQLEEGVNAKGGFGDETEAMIQQTITAGIENLKAQMHDTIMSIEDKKKQKEAMKALEAAEVSLGALFEHGNDLETNAQKVTVRKKDSSGIGGNLAKLRALRGAAATESAE